MAMVECSSDGVDLSSSGYLHIALTMHQLLSNRVKHLVVLLLNVNVQWHIIRYSVVFGVC